MFDNMLSELEARLFRVVETAPVDAVKELRILREIETYIIARKQLHEGAYVTLAPGEPLPPKPSGCTEIVVSQFPLEAQGRLGVPVFWINPRKHEQLDNLTSIVRETTENLRAQRIMEFNSRDPAERREWVDRYLDHETRVGESGMRSLSPEELGEYWSKWRELRELGAEIVAEHALLRPASGPRPAVR